MNYSDFHASDDLISAIYEQGLDPLFHEGSQQESIPIGTPVRGYRFMYESPSGKLYSPFSMLEDRELSLITENFETGVPTGRTSVDIYESQQEFVDSSLQTKDGINKSKTGHGYYYWMDKGKAEDYMRGALLSIEGKQDRTTSSVFQVNKEITQDEYYERENSTYIAGRRLKSSATPIQTLGHTSFCYYHSLREIADSLMIAKSLRLSFFHPLYKCNFTYCRIPSTVFRSYTSASVRSRSNRNS